jgi:hypothetical protein
VPRAAEDLPDLLVTLATQACSDTPDDLSVTITGGPIPSSAASSRCRKRSAGVLGRVDSGPGGRAPSHPGPPRATASSDVCSTSLEHAVPGKDVAQVRAGLQVCA